MKDFIRLARSKVTTYVALGIAALSQLADHAESLVSSWPTLTAYLPQTQVMTSILHYIVSALGILVVYTRIRRELGTPK